MSVFSQRRDRVRQQLKKRRIDAFLVTNPLNVSYLTGFGGDSSFLFLHREESRDVLVSDGRYTTQIEEECHGLGAYIRSGAESMPAALRKVAGAGSSTLGFEADAVSVALHDKIANALPAVTLVPREATVERLRMVKDRTEIAAIRRAIVSARAAFDHIASSAYEHETETGVRNELEYRMRLAGADTVSFPSIVAAGPRAALPHAVPTDTPIKGAAMLLIDWGAMRDRYACDLTRVLFPKKPSARLQKIHAVVQAAQTAAIKAIKPGVPCEEIDRICRNVIEDAGFGKRFIHGTGHGFGLEVHESPRFAPGWKTPLEAGMVLTVEPGIYYPGWGGVRIEDDILVTKTGCEILTR